MNTFAFVALVALVLIVAQADAVSDQQKAYKALGIKVPHPPALCYLITKNEAARFLGMPVHDGESAGAASGCAYRSVSDPDAGILVTRGDRKDWFPPTSSKRYAGLSGVGERAYTDYTDGLGYEATALSGKGVTSVQFGGEKGSKEAAIGLLRIAMNR